MNVSLFNPLYRDKIYEKIKTISGILFSQQILHSVAFLK